jgi:signal peptidase I
VAEGPPVATEPIDPDDGADDPPIAVEQPSDRGADRSRSRRFGEFPLLALVAILLAILIKTFLVQAFFIPSPSMVPTLRQGDRILVCRVCLHVSDIHRGDILVFSDPSPDPQTQRGLLSGFVHWLGEGIGVAQPQDEDFIKRVGALEGETWEIRGGQLFVDGSPIDEPYLNEPIDRRNFGPETVPDGMLLMLGDNRLNSGDSRFSPQEGGLGYVPVDNVIGKAFVVVWPPSRLGGLS